MLDLLTATSDMALLANIGDYFSNAKNIFLVFAGFSLIIFVHELGHFMAAKWCDVRVERFAVGFGKELFGFTRGETRYSFNILPLGGYVKMLGQDDFEIDKSGEIRVKDDPRAFSHKPVGQRMIIVSAGVVANLIFAALIFMGIFMVGKDTNPPFVGLVTADSPAALAGVQPGDHILEIDGRSVYDYQDIQMAIVLADPEKPLKFKVQREVSGREEPKIVEMELAPSMHPNLNLLQVGIWPMMNLTVMGTQFEAGRPEAERIKPGDRIVAVDGEKVDNWLGMFRSILESGQKGVMLTVERPREDPEAEPEILEIPRQPFLALLPEDGGTQKSGDLLGLMALRVIESVSPGMPGEKAGIEPGDVILRLGDQIAPTVEEILDIVSKNASNPLNMQLLRRELNDGAHTYEKVDVTVTPTEGGVMGMRKHKPLIGIDIFAQQFNDRLIVADIRSEYANGAPTAASVLKNQMPRGSLITHVNDEPVATWSELAERFIALAGSDVKMTWQYENGPAESGEFYVPHTLGTTFELPPGYVISKIAGHERITLDKDGVPQEYVVNNARAAREILKDHIGQTVEIEYRPAFGGNVSTVEVGVTEEMLDTWRLRVRYLDLIVGEPLLETMREPNPFKALMIGVRRTYGLIIQVYTTLERMIVSKSVGIEQVSGPVGIVSAGSAMAKHDLMDLVYFLAIISANIAVINFLPLPIVDGGLFVFLLIEKIKGSPLSLKVQVATQMIGLALIISIFVMVTFNDILRLIG